MNYEQANAVKGLAAPVNRVLEGFEWDCKECKGTGKVWYANFLDEADCGKCNGKGKLSYSWTPQVGEWMMWGSNELELICQHNLGEIKNSKHKAEIVPILEWEEIERVLKKAGYQLFIKGFYNRIQCHIFEGDESFVAPIVVIEERNITRQEAVMQAVIELGKELNEKLAEEAPI